MKTLRYITSGWAALVAGLLAFGLLSCEETIRLDERQLLTRYIFEGLVTDQQARHYIRITEGIGFYTPGPTPRVRRASVTVSDDAGNTYNFEETEPGLYEAEFKGEVGRVYTMRAVLENGEVFTASDRMNFIEPIRAMRWEIDERERRRIQGERFSQYFYRVLVDTRDPQETQDFYLFKFFRNDSIMRSSNHENITQGDGLFFADDRLLQGNIDGLRMPYFFSKGDTARYEAYSMSREAYIFYDDLSSVLNNDGGLFGPVPANPQTNIRNAGNLGLGLFQVSAVASKEIVVDP